ncbi:Endonuclease V [Collichthys lucidus]|uniref:Endonuclease V n=1 Tax=Collichthys lucidus TaxID=240159 RepID=A0A4U5U4Z9_COLLU|nr:Endonuclease V [Collichthys lucidus]
MVKIALLSSQLVEGMNPNSASSPSPSSPPLQSFNEQARLRQQVVEEDTEDWQRSPDFSGLQRVGGVDLSFIKADDVNACAQLVVLSYPDLEVVFVDGNGLFHYREFGLACHLGVLSGLPCVGVAKNLLQVQGVFKNEEHQSQIAALQKGGDSFPLTAASGKVLGKALRSSDKSSKPVYVSVGHKISVDTAPLDSGPPQRDWTKVGESRKEQPWGGFERERCVDDRPTAALENTFAYTSQLQIHESQNERRRNRIHFIMPGLTQKNLQRHALCRFASLRQNAAMCRSRIDKLPPPASFFTSVATLLSNAYALTQSPHAPLSDNKNNR